MTESAFAQQINEAIGAHGAWKLRLKTAISTGRSDITPESAGCDDKCAFGAWLYGSDITDSDRSSIPYVVIKRLHAEFHASASEVLGLAIAGKSAHAEELFQSDYGPKSEKLVRALTKWKREINR